LILVLGHHRKYCNGRRAWRRNLVIICALPSL
jgi:hypothetical protein